MPKPLEELRKIRLEKLKKIRSLGIDPYPARCVRGQTMTEALKMMGKKVAVAGRIMSMRGHGGIQFFDLRDKSGQIQLVFKKENLKSGGLKLLDLLDIGDFIDASGEIFKTKAGELSVQVADFHLLTKSVRPLPSKRYGLKDIEGKYRRRYLDLITNFQSKKVFEVRSKLVQGMREFLLARGYVEVETPVLQPLYGGGLARPFKTYHNVLGIPLYMRISTELYLKRLIVGGFEKVFEIAKVFRNEGIDKNHNPEFTMLETMEAYIDYKENMKLVEKMTEYAVEKAIGTTKVDYEGKTIDFKTPWKRVTMVEAVKQETGVDFSKIKSLLKARQVAKDFEVPLDAHLGSAIGLILAAVFEEKVEKTLVQPTIIYDFPVETSPLAKRCSGDPRYVERWEHFVAGVEGSNNYSELNDPLELGKRFRVERDKEKMGDIEAHQTDEGFIEAMEYGMPPTSGIGPGIDRLALVVCHYLGAQNLRDVILFPTMRPKNPQDNGIRGDRETKVEIKETVQDQKKAGIPDEKSKRFVAVLSKKVEIGRLMNALGHMASGLVGGFETPQEMFFLEYEDKDGGFHPNISHFPFIVLKAEGSDQIRELRKKALKKGIRFTNFTSTMTIGTSEEQQEATKKTSESKLEYYGICLFGKTDELRELTKKFSLFRG